MMEAERNMQSSPEDDIRRFLNGDAAGEQIREWLDTPEGSMAHYPAWGHNLAGIKFDPLSEGGEVAVNVEMALTRKMSVDLPDIVLKGVRCDVLAFDMVRVVILHQFGKTVSELRV